ncbi:hypothetical protein N3K66_000861 [Trichothecium roseum]|uniref:Uncharacterized protein n=1 Tax=Trichothecium roseum TaxID=47278 RepID=A0ACC0VD17_9HYPO|nr:hypothetical protein N3K66_000861 [Trichothecium roseum]
MPLQQRMALPLRRSGLAMTTTTTATTSSLLLRPIVASTLPPSPRHSRQAVRSYAVPRSKPNSRIDTRTPTISQASLAHGGLSETGNLPIFPTTFVPFPFSQIPAASLGQKLSYKWVHLKAKFQDVSSVLMAKLASMPTWTTRPAYRPSRSRIAPTAKHMYAEMLQAFADGDAEAVRRLCTPYFASRLVASIERRPSAEGTKFELLGHTRTLWYPSLKSHLINRFDHRDPNNMTEQAVVAVSSRQRTAKFRKVTGREVTGSVKERDQVEYVVLRRSVDSRNWQMSPWKIWGTTTPTSLEEWDERMSMMQKLLQEKAGWKKNERGHKGA